MTHAKIGNEEPIASEERLKIVKRKRGDSGGSGNSGMSKKNKAKTPLSL